MMRFALLASGSKGNCFVLMDEALMILVDCGTTKRYISGCFDELGISVSDLDAVLITHNHTDHISQLKMFSGCRLYSPCRLDYPSIPVRPMEKIQIQHMTVTPLALSHDAEHTAGYIFETWQEKLVYITDTGYVKDEYLKLLKGADYIILESNHDSEMLMNTRRPYYVKMRIASDEGHLCNEDCASILDEITTGKTRMIVLAHISREGNTREKALAVTEAALLKHKGELNRELMLCAAGQYEMIKGGSWPNEKTDCGSVCCPVGMEHLAYLAAGR